MNKKRKVSKKKQSRINILLDQALHLQTKKDFISAEKLIQQVLSIDPNNAMAYLYLGCIAKEFGSLDAAISLLEKSLTLDPNHAESYYNYGVILDACQRFEDSSKAYEKAVSIHKKMDIAWFNLANAYYKNHEYEKVSNAIEILLKIPNHHQLFYPTIEKLYFDIGNIKQSASFYISRMQQHTTFKKNEDALWTYINTQQYLHQPQTLLRQIKSYTSQPFSPELLMRLNTYQAIAEWQLGQLKNCQQSVNTAKQWGASVKDNPVNTSLHSYQLLLNQLLMYCQNNQSEHKDISQTIYLVGDSHSLSNNNQTITIQNKNYQTVTKLLVGCKAFHLSLNNHNKFKESFKYAIADIPEFSSVVMMLGEIDCRVNEGFLPVFKKHGQNLSELIDQTVSAYVSFVVNETKGKKFHLHFYGVPAPKLFSDITSETMELLKQVIFLFNQSLQKHALHSNNTFIDIYSLTNTENGYSHGLYHIDDFHLLPKVIEAADLLSMSN